MEEERTSYNGKKQTVQVIRANGVQYNGVLIQCDRVEIVKEEGLQDAIVFFITGSKPIATFSFNPDIHVLCTNIYDKNGLRIWLETKKAA